MNAQFPFDGMSGGVAGAFSAVVVLFGVIGFIVSIAIFCVVCYIISGCYKKIPQQFRLMEPGMVWLLVIPCFGIVWNFFVWLKLAKSYQAFFASEGISDAGDCGYGLNLAYCIVSVCCLIPCVNYLAIPASIVLMIICLIKAVALKGGIPEVGTYKPIDE